MAKSSEVVDPINWDDARIERLNRLVVKARARGDSERAGELFATLLQIAFTRPAPKIDPEELRRGEVFTDVRAWARRITVLQKHGLLANTVSAQVGLMRSPSRARERRPRRRIRAASSSRTSRAGPAEPEPALGRSLTPLQQAQCLSSAAFEHARAAGDRVFDAFLSIEAAKVARETSRRWWHAA